MQKIPILTRIDLQKTLADLELSDLEFVSIQIGNDDRIHILFANEIPKRINGMYVPTKCNTNYRTCSFSVDWYTGNVYEVHSIHFNNIQQNIHYFQPLGEHFLLLGARTNLYKDRTFDHNAIVADKDGNIIREMCFGDGIQQCLVDSKQHIFTSYFDEGVFGNRGWNQPIGASGLIKWSPDGDKLWENTKYDICDCYAMNVDGNDNLWFYYYTEFELVKTDFKKDIVFQPNVSGASVFMINQRQNEILFDCGYKKHGEFIKMSLGYDKLGAQQPCQFEFEDDIFSFTNFDFRDSKAVFLNRKSELYFTNWV